MQNTKTSSSGKSHIAKIENHIDQKFGQAALKHLEFQILLGIKNDLDKNNTDLKKNEIQSPRDNDYKLIRELRSHIKHFRVSCTSFKICFAVINSNY